MRISDWLDKQPDYGLCPPPMTEKEALDFLIDYLTPPMQIGMSINGDQARTIVVYEILNKYSKRFRKELRDRKKRNRK